MLRECLAGGLLFASAAVAQASAPAPAAAAAPDRGRQRVQLELLHTFTLPGGGTTAAAFAPNGALAADGTWAVSTAFGFEADGGHLFVADAANRQLHLVTLSGAAATVAFRPDGTQLVYSYMPVNSHTPPHEPVLRVLDGKTFELLREIPAPIAWFRFLDDHLAVALQEGQLTVWDTDTFAVAQQLKVDLPVWSASLSEDKRTLAVATRSDVRVFAVRRP